MNHAAIRNLLSKPLAFNMNSSSRLLLKGPDTKDFLHRLSTNEVLSLLPGENCINVLVNPKGRMVDLLHVAILENNQILLITSANQGKTIADWLDQFLFTEQVEIEDISDQGGLIWFSGNLSLPDSTYIIIPSFENKLIFHATQTANEILHSISPHLDFIDQDSFETLRIALGIPAFPNEINENFNPLEIGLKQAIHWAKGCYIGQEVISRLHTYQKQSKQLCLVYADDKNAALIKVGQDIFYEEKNIGTITSSAPIYWLNHANALAVIKLKSNQELPIETAIKQDSNNIKITLSKIIF